MKILTIASLTLMILAAHQLMAADAAMAQLTYKAMGSRGAAGKTTEREKPHAAAVTPEVPTLEPIHWTDIQNAAPLGGPLHLMGQEGEVAQNLEGATIRDVIIRFVDAKGETIPGRVPEAVIRGELQLEPGGEFSQDRVQADLQQLKQLGLFSNVTVSVEEVGADVIVTYNILERSVGALNFGNGENEEISIFTSGGAASRSINFGGGYNNDIGVFGTAAIRDLTIGEIGQQFRGDVKVSLRGGVEYDLRFISPYRVADSAGFGYTLRAFRNRSISEIFNKDIDLPNGDRVRERQFGGNIILTRPLGNWQGNLGFNFTRMSIRDRDGDLSPEDEQGNELTWSGTGIDDLYTISLGVTRDRRDNPFNPTRGSILSLSTEQSIPIGIGHITLNRLQANYIHYIPLHWLDSGDPYALPETLAFNLQGGTVVGELPPHQAFRLGGNNSVRGYGVGDVGSGRSYVLASGEYRFPIWRDVGGVLFADFASDLGSGDTVLGEPAEVRDKPGNGFGVGFGMRVRTFVGLIRLDLGFSDQGDVRLELSTGQRF